MKLNAKQKIIAINGACAMGVLVATALTIGLLDKLTGIDTLFEQIIESGMYFTGIAGMCYFAIVKLKAYMKKLK